MVAKIQFQEFKNGPYVQLFLANKKYSPPVSKTEIFPPSLIQMLLLLELLLLHLDKTRG